MLLGATSLELNDYVYDCPEEYLISERIPHPKYNLSSRYNDIALLRLRGRVTFNPFVRPACLPTDSSIPSDLTAMGWGATDHLSLASEVLLEVTISLFTYTECSSFYRDDETKLSLGIIEETQICSGSRNDEKGACGVSEFLYFS